MPANLEHSAVATGLEKVSFHSSPKEGNAKECSNYCTIAFISHSSKVILCSKFFKPGFNNTWTVNLQIFKLVLEKAEEPEMKLPTSTGSSKKQESSRKASISALLTVPKPLIVWITINWKILKEMGIPDHLNCLEKPVCRSGSNSSITGHGTTDWFQIGKGVCQGCILSPCSIHHEKRWARWSTSWNQDCQETYQ